MASNFASALAAEIEGLERQLDADPRFAKLRELKRIQAMYPPTAGSSDPCLSPPPARTRQPTSSGRSASPERQAILRDAKAVIAGRTTPTPTSEIYDMLMALSVRIPGAAPKNNLSAMLSNSDEFKSHGRSGWTLAAETPEASGDLLSRSAPEASMSSPASPAGEPNNVRPVDPVPGGGT